MGGSSRSAADFNPRSLTGATLTLPYTRSVIAISIHAPSRERLYGPALTAWKKHFNPRSLTGATHKAKDAPTWENISIHAPSRERPQNPTLLLSTATISIHAPSRERRSTFAAVGQSIVTFQSTLPHGSDQGRSSSALAPKVFQSTLPHGSDLRNDININPVRNFNPRSLTGATTIYSLYHLTYEFQSTLPHGSDGGLSTINSGLSLDFNPRSLTGATLNHASSKNCGSISIHAPSRERPGTA